MKKKEIGNSLSFCLNFFDYGTCSCLHSAGQYPVTPSTLKHKHDIISSNIMRLIPELSNITGSPFPALLI